MDCIFIIGRLTKDPAQRVVNTANGQTKVTDVSIATNQRGRSGQPDGTIFYEASIWGNRGDALVQYAHKGDRLAITGSLAKIDTYARKDGNIGATPRVNIVDFEFLGTRNDQGSTNGNAPRATAPVPNYNAPAPVAEPVAVETPDELPF